MVKNVKSKANVGLNNIKEKIVNTFKKQNNQQQEQEQHSQLSQDQPPPVTSGEFPYPQYPY